MMEACHLKMINLLHGAGQQTRQTLRRSQPQRRETAVFVERGSIKRVGDLAQIYEVPSVKLYHDGMWIQPDQLPTRRSPHTYLILWHLPKVYLHQSQIWLVKFRSHHM